MNYITFDEPIGLFANDLMFYFHFLSYFKQLPLVVRGETHTTKSVRACQLINCTDYQFVYAEMLVRTVCGDGGFEQAKIFIKGAIICE